MLYLVLIASLCIYKAAGDCDAFPKSNCIAEGCSWYDTRACYGEGSSDCCYATPTPEPTTPAPTTPAPTTPEPTDACPTGYECSYYTTARCCPSYCVSKSSTLCLSEGGPGCCISTPSPTTPEPTTPAPTTPEPTTPEPTEAVTTCPPEELDDCALYTGVCCPTGDGAQCELNTSSYKCRTSDGLADTGCCIDKTTTTTKAATTTEEATTTKAATTTEKATTKEATTTETATTKEATTTEKATTKSATTTEYEEESTTTKGRSWPTPKPTMRSAEKWEMIHPAYTGGDGELLWHVYYGDFSNDDRFDSFRKAEQWDTKEIKPIIMHDKQFKKYRHSNSQKFKSQSAVITDNNAASGAQSYGSWLIGLSAVLIVLFAVWYKFGPKGKNSEYTPLLTEEKVQYDQ